MGAHGDNNESSDTHGSSKPEELDHLVSQVYDELHRLAQHYLRQQADLALGEASVD